MQKEENVSRLYPFLEVQTTKNYSLFLSNPTKVRPNLVSWISYFLPTSGDNTDQLPNLMPDYMLCFAVMVLTHLPLYENNKDVQVLEQLKNALWFILEPLMVKNENFSLQFYKLLLEMMKCHIDASDQPSEVLNHVGLLINSYTKYY